MRKRINCNAICSSENYRASRKAHVAMLERNHSSFCGIIRSNSESNITDYKPKYRTIRVWGKPLVVTNEEYQMYCQS